MRSAASICLVLSLGSPCLAQQAAAPDASSMPKLERFSPGQADKALNPCEDFFQYACKKWNDSNPIPPDQARWSTFDSLAVWNVAALRNTLEDSASHAGRSAIDQKVGAYYASCMDEAAIDKAGLAPLQPVLDHIAGLKNRSELPEVVAYIHQRIRPANLNFIDAEYQGVLFGLYAIPDFSNAGLNLAALDQSGMGLPGREFYLDNDEKSKEIRDKYVKHIARMLVLTGEPEAQAASEATAILKFETALANAAMEIVARRDPKNQNNKMSLAQVQALTPGFDWKRYFAAMHAPISPQYLVLAPEFFRGVQKLIDSESLDNWRAYLRYSTVSFLSPFLGQPFVDENFDFNGRVLFGSQQNQPRWRRCSRYADADLGEAVGQAYVTKYFPPQNKARMLEMVKGIENALNNEITSAGWLSPQTKKLAHEKLAAQVDKIGYPDDWRDYSSLQIKSGDFLGNVQRSAQFEIEHRMAKFGKPVDRQEWGMTPPTVNAYEDPQTNTINFPAGILQPPFFEGSEIDAVNYGAIGAVIGHEITHGYDDQGRKFDAEGDLRDWWTQADSAAYDDRDGCITDEYTQDVPEAGVKQNGKLSAGEDTADNGGIHLTMGALENKLKSEGKDMSSPAGNGLTEAQSFFLSYANVWCGDQRPEAARTAVMTQGHSLGRYRVNNVVGNMPEFAKAFSCHSGQPMVHAKQCRVW